MSADIHLAAGCGPVACGVLFVCLCVCLLMKVYHTLKLHSVECAQLMREVSLHAGVDHPSILKLYAAFQEGTKVSLKQWSMRQPAQPRQ